MTIWKKGRRADRVGEEGPSGFLGSMSFLLVGESRSFTIPVCMYVGSRPAIMHLPGQKSCRPQAIVILAKTCSSFHLGVPDNLVCR
jgi:hypothetical protein